MGDIVKCYNVKLSMCRNYNRIAEYYGNITVSLNIFGSCRYYTTKIGHRQAENSKFLKVFADSAIIWVENGYNISVEYEILGGKMKKDFDLIVRQLESDVESVRIYTLGDLHIGSQEFNMEKWVRWKKMILEDKDAYIIGNGDWVDNGLRNSKTSSYEAVMRPMEQKEWLKKELLELKDRFIGACRGNHEERSVKESDDCPMYDVMSKLDIEDLYRENMAVIKLSL